MKHSLLVDCYCMVDGLKLYLRQAGDSIIQSRFYMDRNMTTM